MLFITSNWIFNLQLQATVRVLQTLPRNGTGFITEIPGEPKLSNF